MNRAIIEGCSSIDGPENLNRRIYIKTNIPAWGALIANIAAEADLSGCLSISLPIYYSGWNWFHSDVKLRTLAFIPELRWWPKAVAEGNSGLFFNIHAGIASFNVALGGEHRYQDHNRRSPAFGGGIGAGYRFRFCGNPRWSMEAGIGAGIYRLDYDVFQNSGNGLLTDRRKRTFTGIDQAFLSIAYSFRLKKPANRNREGGGL